MADWDDDITRDLTTRPGEAVVIERERLDSACRVLQALLCGRYDDKGLAVAVRAAADPFGTLESLLLALYRELPRRTTPRCGGAT